MFFMFGSFSFVMAVIVYFLIPETKGLSLEQMDELFGVNDMVKTMDDEPEVAAGTTIQDVAEWPREK